MPHVLHYNKTTISLGLHVVTHPKKLQCCHVVLLWYGLACPKFSEMTNRKYLWKGLKDCVDFVHVVIWFLLDIHWSYKNMLFWAGIVRHRLSANQIVRYFKLKTWKLYEVSSWFFASIEATKISCYFGLWPQILLANQFTGFFTFDLFDLLILIPGVHY